MPRLGRFVGGSLIASIGFASSACGRSALDDDLAAVGTSSNVDGGRETSTPPPSSPGPPTTTCIPGGSGCTSSLDCCSGNCADGVCAVPDPSCLQRGAPCGALSDCCGALSCHGGVCGGPTPPPQCQPPGATCGGPSDCCNGLPCTGGTCGGVPPACKPDRASCASAAECCAGQCNAFVCGGPFACPPAAGECGGCIAARCCQEQGVCLLEAACTASWTCFNDCRARGGGFNCANDCLSKPPTQAENNVYACGFQQCALECQ